jgi:hypothetical protein
MIRQRRNSLVAIEQDTELMEMLHEYESEKMVSLFVIRQSEKMQDA